MDINEIRTIPQAGWVEYIHWLLGRRKRFVVRENSMVPTLMPGDTVLAEMGSVVEVGDIAIARWNDRFAARSNSLASPAEFLLIKRVSDIFHDGSVYLISDNANDPNVRDSRHFGVMAADQILGRVTSRLAAASSTPSYF